MGVLEGRASANSLGRSTPGGGRNGQDSNVVIVA